MAVSKKEQERRVSIWSGRKSGAALLDDLMIAKKKSENAAYVLFTKLNFFDLSRLVLGETLSREFKISFLRSETGELELRPPTTMSVIYDNRLKLSACGLIEKSLHFKSKKWFESEKQNGVFWLLLLLHRHRIMLMGPFDQIMS